MANAKMKADAVIDLVNDALHRSAMGEVVSSFELKRWERDAKSSMATNPADAHMALAGIAFLRRDYDTAVRHHELSIGVAPVRALALANFASGLANMGRPLKALEVAKSVFETDKADLGILRNIIDYACDAGRYLEAHHWVEYARSHLPTDDADRLFSGCIALPDGLTDRIVPFVTESGLDDQVISQVYSVAYELLYRERIWVPHVVPCVERDEGFPWLNVFFIIDASVEDIVDLNFELAEKRAIGKTSGQQEELVSVVFRRTTINRKPAEVAHAN